jgi:transcriptional regulator with XRE-family HTH domain
MAGITYPKHPRQPSFRKAPDGVIALTLSTFVGGTAGAYPPLFDFRIVSFRGPTQVNARVKPAETPYAPNPAQILSRIREVFGLRMSEVARIFGVSRRAAYDWLGGATPRPDTVARIYNIGKYAEELRAAGIANIGHYVRRPIVSGRSLLDLLKSGENMDAAIAIIRPVAAEEAMNRKQLGRRTSEVMTDRTDNIDEVSTPISD